MIERAITSTASLLLLIFVGVLLGKSPVIKKNNGDLVISHFLANWALPCFIFNNIYSSFEGPRDIVDVFINLPISFGLILLMLVIGAVFARLMKISPERQGAFANANAFANTSFVGFPMITTLFGPEIMPYGMVYYIANTLLFFTAGTWLLARDAGKNEPIFTKAGLKKIFTPMMISMLLGIAAKLCNLHLPGFVDNSLDYFNSVCPCMGMIFVGIVISKNASGLKTYVGDISRLILLRYFVTPFVIGSFLLLIPADNTIKAAYFILSLLPSITQMSIMSRVIGSDSTFCAIWLTVSSTIGIAYVPVIVLLAEKIFKFI